MGSGEGRLGERRGGEMRGGDGGDCWKERAGNMTLGRTLKTPPLPPPRTPLRCRACGQLRPEKRKKKRVWEDLGTAARWTDRLLPRSGGKMKNYRCYQRQ